MSSPIATPCRLPDDVSMTTYRDGSGGLKEVEVAVARPPMLVDRLQLPTATT